MNFKLDYGVIMSQAQIKLRKYLNADALFKLVHSGFKKIKDHRSTDVDISLADALMSSSALFSLKDSSLPAFDKRRVKDKNLKKIYKINKVPCDTQMRTILDEVEPSEIGPVFKDVFRQIQRGKALEKMVFMEGCHLLSLDGTGYFSSDKIHCEFCLEKKNSKTGKVTYLHQMSGAAIVHPDFKEVIPLMPEPIVKQDGETKNDCERNAGKRFFEQLRKDHPHQPLIIVEDALSSNAPHIHELMKHNLHYILGVKPGDHAFLSGQVELAEDAGLVTAIEFTADNVIHRFRFVNLMPLNKSNQELLVNFVEYQEVKNEKIQHFTWITDFLITEENVFKIMRGGRARWKIENETFNTLKNQGYHFEHNFGHGKKHLSAVFAMIMMLAFLADQVQQSSCKLFQAVWEKEGSKKSLWENMRSLFYSLKFDSMEKLFKALLYGYKINELTIFEDTS